jgi:hypothetical protein
LVTLFQGVYSNPAVNNQWHAGAYGTSTTTGNLTSAAYVRTSRSIVGLYTQCGTLTASGSYPTSCLTLSNNEFLATVSPKTTVNTEGAKRLVYVPSSSLFGLTGPAMNHIDNVVSVNGTCSVYLSGNATHYYHGRLLGKSASNQYLQPIQDGNSILVRSESDTRYAPADLLPATATANQILTYNGTAWGAANAPASGGGGGLTQTTADTLYQPKLGNATYTKVTVPALTSGINAFSGDSYLDVTGTLGSGGKNTTYLRGVVYHASAPDVPYGTVVGEYQTDSAGGTLGGYGLLKTDYREIGLYSKGDGVARVSYISVRKDTIYLSAGTDGDASAVQLQADGGAIYTPPATLKTLTNALSMLNMGQMDVRYAAKPATTFTGTFTTQDGKTVTVENGVIKTVV